MQQANPKQLPPEVAAVRERVRAWRATSRRGRSTPEELWAEAVALASKRGAYRAVALCRAP